jgi:hypothetical protein
VNLQSQFIICWLEVAVTVGLLGAVGVVVVVVVVVFWKEALILMEALLPKILG